MNRSGAEDPILTRGFALLFGAHFLQALGYASMLLLPLYLEWLDATRAQIGAAMAAASIGGLLGRPLVGWGLDVLGRKTVLTIGTLLLVFGMTSVFLIDRMSPWVYAMRVLVGLGAGTTFTAYFTFAADIIPISRRTEGIALFGISGLAPLVINPIAPELGVTAPDLRWFFPVIGLVILLSIPLLLSVPRPERIGEQAAFAWKKVGVALTRRPLLPVWIATFVFAGLVAVFMAFATVAGKTRGIENPALVWLTYAGGALTVRLFGAKLPDRFGPSRVGWAALFSYALGFFTISVAATPGAVALAGLLAGMGHGYCFPVLTGQVVSRSPDELRGTAMSAFTGLWEVARLGLAPLFGWIADGVGDETMLKTAGVCGVVGLVVWILAERFAAERGPGRSGRPGGRAG